jgi:predicted AlkP superfamily pyrophosphatase or phosphodiesterase
MNHRLRPRTLRLRVLTALLFLTAATSAVAAPVLMISIDGMKPEYVTQADRHGLKVPYLRSLMRDGAYAEGVTGVWPTVTYPSHTTMVTGVPPAEHGILSNTLFDPDRALDGAWYWYTPEIHVPTVWQAAHAAGLRTASVGWPVTIGATAIDYLIPEYWRGGAPGDTMGPTDRYLIAALSRPDGMLDEMQQRLGPYMKGNETTLAGDEIKAGKVIEALDSMVSRIAAAALEADPSTVILIVSDHGFAKLTHHINLRIPFLKSGLIQMSNEPNRDDRSIVGWKAMPWFSSGMAAIMLHDPNDKAAAEQAGALLHKLAADPANGIAAVLTHDEILKRGGFPEAAYVVVFKSGYYAGNEETGPLITPITASKGGHGFSPDQPEMRSSFFLAGPGIAPHRNLGQIDMLQIAPTVAAILNVPLPTAKAQPLPIH